MDNNGTPYEIIVGPFKLYYAPVGTAFPDVGSDPAVAWKPIGLNGDKSQVEGSVKIKHEQTIKKIFASGATGAIKAVRDQESLEAMIEIMDLTLEAYSLALNSQPVAVTPAAGGNAAQKAVALRQGIVVNEMALLVRGPSPYIQAGILQFELPRCFQDGKPNPILSKGKPAGLALSFCALEDLTAATDDARFGYLRAQTA